MFCSLLPAVAAGSLSLPLLTLPHILTLDQLPSTSIDPTFARPAGVSTTPQGLQLGLNYTRLRPELRTGDPRGRVGEARELDGGQGSTCKSYTTGKDDLRPPRARPLRPLRWVPVQPTYLNRHAGYIHTTGCSKVPLIQTLNPEPSTLACHMHIAGTLKGACGRLRRECGKAPSCDKTPSKVPQRCPEATPKVPLASPTQWNERRRGQGVKGWPREG